MLIDKIGGEMLAQVRFFYRSGPLQGRGLVSSGIVVTNLILPASDKGEKRKTGSPTKKSAAKYAWCHQAYWDPSQELDDGGVNECDVPPIAMLRNTSCVLGPFLHEIRTCA